MADERAGRACLGRLAKLLAARSGRRQTAGRARLLIERGIQLWSQRKSRDGASAMIGTGCAETGADAGRRAITSWVARAGTDRRLGPV